QERHDHVVEKRVGEQRRRHQNQCQSRRCQRCVSHRHSLAKDRSTKTREHVSMKNIATLAWCCRSFAISGCCIAPSSAVLVRSLVCQEMPDNFFRESRLASSVWLNKNLSRPNLLPARWIS